ncbi:hypothetical protein EJV46_05890 [Roseococcus sp. SYP-B2431]|uniref:hypothetical protein n=1 Tax=Roseococcus sp. SYP-B2431 TaxID=2496640 RepID=UPI00103C006A|nr:hypothetical protein [Roseococcus sp. SYP-B2431]TCI00181.1 hypothetical protein EJV46_05890 [Roseococcus sp. SYP-B2431]
MAKIAADIEGHVARFAHLRAEAEAAHEDGIQAAAGQIARASLEKLRFSMAHVAAPHPPMALRRGAR